TRLTHAAFPVNGRLYVCDFYLPGPSIVIECWQSTSRRGVALTWVEKNACYIDWKFRRIKGVSPTVKCVALVEVGQAEPSLVKEYVGPVMEHADVVCYSMEDLSKVVRDCCRVGS
ncbi:MAG TPA: hypothetical protein VGS11_10440, partial [Candidatus Bathyarchaeia archaeon]|nr:hypothetical protein [Candidatus Bathyarchaeia archaeon]